MTSGFTIVPVLAQMWGGDYSPSPADMLLRFFVAAVGFAFSIGILLAVILLIHYLLTLPMRRAEYARLFLDLVEGALNRGQPVEEMIVSVAKSRDTAVGVRFHLLATYIQGGMKFGEALQNVPRFLPPQIDEMLLAGAKLGDLRRVIPACREILRDRPPGVRSAIHYMILLVLLCSPAFVGILTLETVFVVPRFKEVAAGMNTMLWPITVFVFANSFYFACFALLIFFLLVLAAAIYIGGPQFCRLFQFQGLPVVDWMAWRIPWKQKRLQRTFSAMLAVLLDGGVPEAEAVRLAGDCTANEICRRRAQRIIAALRQGAKLNDAVRAFDDSGEFHWRLANAAHSRGGFLNALRGWHESLDAKAFQQEQATAHSVTTGVVILNGALVALIATAMFGMLVAILDAMLSTL